MIEGAVRGGEVDDVFGDGGTGEAVVAGIVLERANVGDGACDGLA